MHGDNASGRARTNAELSILRQRCSMLWIRCVVDGCFPAAGRPSDAGMPVCVAFGALRASLAPPQVYGDLARPGPWGGLQGGLDTVLLV